VHARGAKPATPAAEHPGQWAPSINCKTAKALAIKLPPSIVLRACEGTE